MLPDEKLKEIADFAQAVASKHFGKTVGVILIIDDPDEPMKSSISNVTDDKYHDSLLDAVRKTTTT